MRRRFAMTIAAAITVVALIAPIEAGTLERQRDKNGPDHDERAEPEKRDTAADPIFVQIAPGTNAESRPGQDKEERDAKRKLDEQMASFTGDLANYTRDLARYTLLLAIVGFIQIAVFIAQLIFIFRQERAARSHERAYVFGTPRPSRGDAIVLLGSDDPTPAKRATEFRLFVDNPGRTIAVINSVQWRVLPMAQLPDIPDYGEATVVFQPLHPDEEKVPTKAPPMYYMHDWNEPHVIFGRIVYQDAFRETHASGFLFEILRGHGAHYQHVAVADERYKKYYQWT